MNTIFKLNETVYHYNYGKGSIENVTSSLIRIHFEAIGLMTFTMEYSRITLSYKPYDLVNGGFSQEKPLPEIQKGTLVYVKHSDDIWEMRYYSHRGEDGKHYVFMNQRNEGGIVSFREISLENPLI